MLAFQRNTVNILTLGQEPGGDWLDVLLQVGIFATFVVFGLALVVKKLGLSKKKRADEEDKSST